MELEYKGYKATLEVDYPKIEFFTTFVYDDYWDNKYVVTFNSPLTQCKSKELNTREVQLIKALYTRWWQQAIDKIENEDGK